MSLKTKNTFVILERVLPNPASNVIVGIFSTEAKADLAKQEYTKRIEEKGDEDGYISNRLFDMVFFNTEYNIEEEKEYKSGELIYMILNIYHRRDLIITLPQFFSASKRIAIEWAKKESTEEKKKSPFSYFEIERVEIDHIRYMNTEREVI